MLEPLLEARKKYVAEELRVIRTSLRRLEYNLREAEAGLPSMRIQGEIDDINEGIITLQQEFENLRALKSNQGAIGERLAKIPKEIEALQRERSAGVELLGHMQSGEKTGDSAKDEIISKEINLQEKIAELKTGIAEFKNQLQALEGEQDSYLRSMRGEDEAKSTSNVGNYKPPL